MSKANPDSIRDQEKSHRKPDVASVIADEVARTKALVQDAEASEVPHEGNAVEDVPKPVGLEDELPHSPAKLARLGLTGILPASVMNDDPVFQEFVYAVTQPDFREDYPTWGAMAKRFSVTVPQVKSWMLTNEIADAVKQSVKHEAALQMPDILRSVYLRAKTTGDPHAAAFVRDTAGMGRGQQDDALGKLESTLRDIAKQAAKKNPRVQTIKVIEVDSESA